VSKKKGKKRPGFSVPVALGQKHVALSLAPVIEKRPATSGQTSWNDEHPSWRVAQLELVDQFGWYTLSRDKLLDIRKHLAEFESMTWNEISVKAKYFHHAIPVNNIISVAQKRLEVMGLHMLDELFRFRLANMERVWGYRDRGTMHLLWWDPDHKICPSRK
jgi:hypothetical protein